MENKDEQPRGTVRRFIEQFKIRDYEAARAAVVGLTAAGFDVDIKPFTPYNERTREPKSEFTYLVITVYRRG